MNISSRLYAAFVHLALTAAVVSAVAGIIFGVWFPGAFSDMVGGKKLFLLVLFCDLALGPLISLVIYNPRKPRAELIRDYTVVGVLQIAALIYGVAVVIDSRPIYVAFVVDRLEVVAALELDDVDLKQAKDVRYRSRGWVGPELISVERPQNPEERAEALFSALGGKDLHLIPKYYRPYENALSQIRQRSLPVVDLLSLKSESKALVTAALNDIGESADELRWLPVHHRFGFWVALIDAESGKPLRYLPIDPYG